GKGLFNEKEETSFNFKYTPEGKDVNNINIMDISKNKTENNDLARVIIKHLGIDSSKSSKNPLTKGLEDGTITKETISDLLCQNDVKAELKNAFKKGHMKNFQKYLYFISLTQIASNEINTKKSNSRNNIGYIYCKNLVENNKNFDLAFSKAEVEGKNALTRFYTNKKNYSYSCKRLLGYNGKVEIYVDTKSSKLPPDYFDTDNNGNRTYKPEPQLLATVTTKNGINRYKNRLGYYTYAYNMNIRMKYHVDYLDNRISNDPANILDIENLGTGATTIKEVMRASVDENFGKIEGSGDDGRAAAGEIVLGPYAITGINEPDNRWSDEDRGKPVERHDLPKNPNGSYKRALPLNTERSREAWHELVEYLKMNIKPETSINSDVDRLLSSEIIDNSIKSINSLKVRVQEYQKNLNNAIIIIEKNNSNLQKDIDNSTKVDYQKTVKNLIENESKVTMIANQLYTSMNIENERYKKAIETMDKSTD
ncbi:MAG TPA: hypothetical protein QKA14_01060, partial [Candidatus Megaira endosymbiont of Hartmannula sinica]|nr:hypothetical protein [Candidatus Megaera endosymbiont of Hartmannula sinica]